MTFDLTKPSPDAGHEGIRQAVVQAIGDLGLSLELVDMLFVFLDESLAEREQLRADLAALGERVTALENPTPSL